MDNLQAVSILLLVSRSLFVLHYHLLLHDQVCHPTTARIAVKCTLQSTPCLALPLRATPLVSPIAIQLVTRSLIHVLLTQTIETAMVHTNL